MNPSNPGDGNDRRSFLRNLALGTSAGLIPSHPALATTQDPPSLDQPSPPTEAKARMDLLVARFGERLPAEARGEVARQLEGVVRQGQQLRKFVLENGDEPFPTFRPHRAPSRS